MATIKDYELEGRGLIPPYGPARGMLQALNLLEEIDASIPDDDDGDDDSIGGYYSRN